MTQAQLNADAEAAAVDPKFNDALFKALRAAFRSPDTEARVFFANDGQFVLARAVIDHLITTFPAYRAILKERRHDRRRELLVYELTNGSALALGVKKLEHLTVAADADAAAKNARRRAQEAAAGRHSK
jgi:hypothetical protein